MDAEQAHERRYAHCDNQPDDQRQCQNGGGRMDHPLLREDHQATYGTDESTRDAGEGERLQRICGR